MPVTIPLLLTVATPLDPLLHVPHETVSVKAVVDPIHTVGVPVMGTAEGFMVIVCVVDVNGEAQ